MLGRSVKLLKTDIPLRAHGSRHFRRLFFPGQHPLDAGGNAVRVKAVFMQSSL
jgi:hypothetical protein